MNMKEQLRAVAKEYARQFGQIIGIEHAYLVDEDILVDDFEFGDYSFNMKDMQEVIDHLDDWVKKYGTIEKVGEEVIKWYDWLLADDENYMTIYSWLYGGCPNKSTEEYFRLKKQLKVLKQVELEYQTHSIGNVIMQLEARIKEIEKLETKKI